MWYLIVLLIVLAVWLIYRYNEKIGQWLPWMWKNIGQPIFNYLFVLSVRKITMAYFTTVAGINVAFPVIELAIDTNHNIKAAFSLNGSGFDWAAVAITAFLTIAYVAFIIYENNRLRNAPMNSVVDVVEAVQQQVGRGSLEIVKNTLPQIKKCITSLHVDTAYGLLETMRKEVDSARMPDWSLLSRIDYLMGACKRFKDGAVCRKHLLKAYEEMEKAGQFDVEIVAGRIYAACKDSDKETAHRLANELKERDSENVWCWIPTLLWSDDIKQDMGALPAAVGENHKMYAELLSLGRNDVLEVQNAITLEVPALTDMSLDSFVLWPYWLSVALTQFVSNWRMSADGGRGETEATQRMLAVTDKYYELLHQTELPNLMPDIDFIHTFVAFTHDHCPQRIEEMGGHKPTDTLKDLYYLLYASMLQSEKRYGEALKVLADYDGEPSISVQHYRLQIAVLTDNISEIEKVFKVVAEQQLTVPNVMTGHFCAALHICAEKLTEAVAALKFEDETTRRLYLELYNFKVGNVVDIDYVKAHKDEIPRDMLAYMATLLQQYGMTEDAIAMLESVLSNVYFDYRNYVYLELLQSDKKYNAKLYAYLKHLRGKGMATDDLMQRELQMAERMMDFERTLEITSILIKKHPENGILMEHHLMALYRNGKNEEIEELFVGLKNLEYPETSVQNIFNVYLIIGQYEKALAFLYDEIQKNNTQTLRDFFFEVHLHKDIEAIIMKQYDVVTLDSFVLLDVDGKEEYTSIRPGSYLEELIGKKVGEEISYDAVNRQVKVRVLAIFNRYFKLMKEISDEIAKNQSKRIRSFTIDDLEGGEGILANLAKIAGNGNDDRTEEERLKVQYEAGSTTMYNFVNQHQLFAELYKLLFGDFRVRMIPTQVVKHQVQMAGIKVKEMTPVLDLSSLLVLHEMQVKYQLVFPMKFIVIRSLQVAIHDAAVKERNAVPSFLSDKVTALLTIRQTEPQEHPLLSKLRMLEQWIMDYCEVVDDDSLLTMDTDGLPNDLSVMYMQTVRVANQPDRLLLTEDWTATQINFGAFPAMNVVNWLSVMGLGDERLLHLDMARINYVGCNLSADYIFEQYNSKRANQDNSFACCLENIEFNPYNATETFRAGHLMLSGIVTPSDRLTVSSMFASVFRNLDYQTAANVFNMAVRMYRNAEYQGCLMQGFKMAHPIVL